jgi:NhaP-type Na+/H+ or K+/H+ antiporter
VEPAALCAILASIVVWAAISSRMAVITTPMFFVAIGVLLAQGLHLLDLELDPHLAKIIAEVTLVWVLFADASRVKVRELSLDRGRYFRLLGLGLPLTMAMGALAASYLLGLSFWYAVLVGAALAPTDAALGSAVVSDRRVPKRVRHTLNVESGLNDGIATPVVTLALAALASEAGVALQGAPSRALLGLLLGTAIGVLVGAAGGILLRQARRYGWSSEELTGPAVLALSLLAYAVALALDANGFVAAFVGGIAFGAGSGRGREKEVYYVEQTCGLASMVAWLLFGAVAVPLLAGSMSWPVVAYGILSLTLIRMLPVVLCLLGSGVDALSALFIGWFGPRGLASIVFALLTVEELHRVPGPTNLTVGTIGFTVLLSVLLHGLSARPLAGRYAARRGELHTDHPEPIVRHLVSQARPDADGSGGGGG